jgi:hypothetical protein
MPRSRALLTLLTICLSAPLVAALGCGGRIDAVDGGSPGLDCPPAGSVHGGAPCESAALTSCPSVVPTSDCTGLRTTVVVSCDCVGRVWGCETPFVPTCQDASADGDVIESGEPFEAEPPPVACPPRDSLLANTPCALAGQACAGDATTCFGAVFYEPLRCEWDTSAEALRWQSFATTVCGDR